MFSFISKIHEWHGRASARRIYSFIHAVGLPPNINDEKHYRAWIDKLWSAMELSVGVPPNPLDDLGMKLLEEVLKCKDCWGWFYHIMGNLIKDGTPSRENTFDRIKAANSQNLMNFQAILTEKHLMIDQPTLFILLDNLASLHKCGSTYNK